MNELVLYGVTAVVVTVATITAVVKYELKRAYFRGFDDGYYVGIEFDRRMTENAKEYAEIIRKEER